MNSAEKNRIIVLGAGVTPNARPGFDGKLRTLAAIKYSETFAQAPSIIFTGGKTAGEQLPSEAEAMMRYALLHGGSLLTFGIEDKATDTITNLKNTLHDLSSSSIENTTIITNSYHIPRVRELCRQLDISPKILSAEELAVRRNHRYKQLTEQRERSFEMSERRLLEKVLLMLSRTQFGREVLTKITKKTRT